MLDGCVPGGEGVDINIEEASDFAVAVTTAIDINFKEGIDAIVLAEAEVAVGGGKGIANAVTTENTRICRGEIKNIATDTDLEVGDDEGGICDGLVVDITAISFPLLFIEQIDLGDVESIAAGTAF